MDINTGGFRLTHALLMQKIITEKKNQIFFREKFIERNFVNSKVIYNVI